MERTFIAIKPDAVQRGLVGEIIGRFEKKGYKIIGLKMMHISRETADEHYAEHHGKPFFERLVNFISSGPIVAIVVAGENAVKTARKLLGSTSPQDAEPGSIRFDYGQCLHRNIIHGSDCVESAEREIKIFFNENELMTGWDRCTDLWAFGPECPGE